MYRQEARHNYLFGKCIYGRWINKGKVPAVETMCVMHRNNYMPSSLCKYMTSVIRCQSHLWLF